MNLSGIAVSALATINLHSLNNEGAEGNYLQTRQVQIVDEAGELQTVNAISGDMFKHIQAAHLQSIAVDEGLSLCDGCKKLDANRVGADTEFAAAFEKDATDSEILTGAVRHCVIDDLEGILITSEVGGKKRSIGRKSVVEIGWLVGRPESTRTESFFHVKYVPEGRGKGAGESGNLGQNIFHRPASSGQYAVVMNADLYRVGYNDITQERVLDDDEINRRTKALLQSILFAFLKPSGAHRNTQHPHITGLEGCITLSYGSYPAPVASPLNPKYRAELASVTETLNSFKGNQVQIREFGSVSQFAEEMRRIIEDIGA